MDNSITNKMIFNRMGWIFNILLFFSAVNPAVILMILYVANPALQNNMAISLLIVYASMYLIGFPIMLLAAKELPEFPEAEKPMPRKISVGTMVALYPICMAVMGILSITTTIIESILGRSGTVTTLDLIADNHSVWVMFFCGVIVAPIMEEVIYRRFIYKRLGYFGVFTYVIWSSVIFGLIHMNFGQSVYAGALGVIFAMMMYYTGSVKYSLFMHMAVNFTGGIGIGNIILRSGNETTVRIYSGCNVVLILIGTILGICFLIRNYSRLKAQITNRRAVRLQEMFLNPGTLVFSLVCLFFIVVAFFT